MFDFNELNSLSFNDLDFLLILSCNATFRIFGLNTNVEENEIKEFLDKYFTNESRVNIS